ncbi:MAG: leucine--tRNA ligase, partial [Bacteroidota bacterium]
VERKKMRQWSMRITAYSERLLSGLDTLNWSDALKEMQRNWIGKSHGAELDFEVKNGGVSLTCFTTRPDTIYGVTFVVMAPEHELALKLTTDEQRAEVETYIEKAKNRSERERQAEVKQVSGVFTGAYVKNPISGEDIPLWIADYVLAGYGTGVVMAVPSSDDRDFRFAKHFDLPILPVIEGTEELEDPTEIKRGKMINSGFLNGMETDEAIQAVIQKAENEELGKGKVNYRLRDAVFSRQRYWGEPVPVYFENGIPRLVPEEKLPLVLTEIDEYKPTAEGEPPLGRATDWKYEGEHPYELTTMPGWAGSSWYFLRYMDANNEERFASEEALNYWREVDFYIVGTEHAVGHLLYSRFWTKFLHDRGFVPFDEPFKKLVNQGMIQGRSSIAYRVKNENKYVSADRKDEFETSSIHVLISCVKNDVLDIEAFKAWKHDAADAEFILSEDGKFYCDSQVEKMSKRWYNVVNPDDFVAEYSADTLRLYEMFLGPLESSKPWDTSGTDGVYRFLKKLWRLFTDKEGNFAISDDAPTKAELKTLHQTIKKVEEDIERGSYNTCVSAFMVCVNELSSQKCNKRQVLEPLVVLMSPFTPHLSEELWHRLDESRTTAGKTVFDETFPTFDEKHLKEDSIEYPISVNGKVRAKLSFPVDATKDEVEAAVLADERIQKWTEGKPPKKFIFVPKRIVNVVV